MGEPIFLFKVALAGQKSVWRRIAVRGNQTLDDLHDAIFDAFDREEEHLYSFYFPRPGSKGRARIRQAEEFACSYTADEMGVQGADVKLTSLSLTPRRKFYYLFDFGDEWWHDITVEKIDAPPERGKYPRLLEKHGASPPQYPDPDEEDWDGNERE